MTGVPSIVILAGGRATRFPGKLDAPVDGEPMLQRVFRNASATGWPVYLAGSAPYLPKIAGHLKARILADRIPGGGPLQAAVSAGHKLRGKRVALLGGDMPYVTAEALQLLRLAWQPGDDAVVAKHDGRWEPLAALYDRSTLVTEGAIALRRGQRAMHALLERVRKRGVALPACLFANVNSPHDVPARTPA